MNSGRFSDKELQELHEEVRFYIPKFVKLQEDVSAHLLEEREGKVLLKSLHNEVTCLHRNMRKYQPVLENLEKMLPKLDELLERFSQAKGIFWFLILVGGAIIAQAFGLFGRAVAYVRGLFS